jgi:hypothetical protein
MGPPAQRALWLGEIAELGILDRKNIRIRKKRWGDKEMGCWGDKVLR